jgi:RNA polymerase sigma factor (sigma-70 family)
MARDTWLAENFEQHRGRLTAVANRMLGSTGEAEDAVQETWLRLSRSDTGAVENLGGWLTTVLSRVCLNMLQARRTRPETPIDPELPEPPPGSAPGPGASAAPADPEQEALLAESVGLALLVVLDTLTPAERVALVLHDMFAVPFEQIAPVVGRTPAATRQLASRARRRVRGFDESPAEADRVRQAKAVDAFLAAARRGDFEALLTVLDPEVVMRSDAAAVALGATAEMRGANAVATFLSRARGARPALVDGRAAAAWVQAGQVRVLFDFTVHEDRITAVDLIGDRTSLAGLDLEFPEPEEPPLRRRG